MKELRIHDPSILLFPWKEEDYKLEALTNLDSLGKDLFRMRKYVHRMHVTANGKRLWVKVLLGMQLPFREIHTNMGHWWKANGFAMFACPLPCEETEFVGRLMYSTR